VLQIWTAFAIDAWCIVASIYWRRDLYLPFFCTFLYLSISIPSLSPSILKTKNNSRSGSEANNSLRLPNFPQIAYLFCFTWWKRKYIKITAIEKFKERRTYIVNTG
jgi:hypothetical protein